MSTPRATSLYPTPPISSDDRHTTAALATLLHSPHPAERSEGKLAIIRVISNTTRVKSNTSPNSNLSETEGVIGGNRARAVVSFDLPQSRFVLSGDRGRLYALSVCNLHDTWIAEANI